MRIPTHSVHPFRFIPHSKLKVFLLYNSKHMQKKSQTEESNILSHSVIFSITMYSCLLLGLLRGLIVAKLLGPAVYGIRNVFGVIMEFNGYSHLGSIFAMNREVPYYRGRNEEEKADLMISSTYWSNMFLVLIVGATFSIASFYLRGGTWDSNYCDLMLFSGVLIITGRLKDFYETKLKLENNFYFLSKIELFSRILGIISCIILTYYFYLRGFFAGLLIGDLLFIVSALKNERRIPSLIVSFPIIKGLVKVGFPIMLGGIFLMFLNNADKIMILSMLTEEELGFYGIATVATGLIGIVPRAIYSVTLPPLMKKYGQTKDIYRIKNYFVQPTVIIAYLLPFLLASIYFGIHLLIQYFLIKYLPSIKVVKILTLGLFFSAIPTMAVSVCYAIDKRINVVYLTIPSVILNIIINYSLIRLGMGIEGVAIGTGISYFVFCSTLLWYTMKQYKSTFEEYIKIFLMMYAPFVYALCIIVILDNFFHFLSFGFWMDVRHTVLQLVFFCLCYGFIFVFVRKEAAFVRLFDKFPRVSSLFRKVKDHP